MSYQQPGEKKTLCFANTHTHTQTLSAAKLLLMRLFCFLQLNKNHFDHTVNEQMKSVKKNKGKKSGDATEWDLFHKSAYKHMHTND